MTVYYTRSKKDRKLIGLTGFSQNTGRGITSPHSQLDLKGIQHYRIFFPNYIAAAPLPVCSSSRILAVTEA